VIRKYLNGVYIGENAITPGSSRWAIWNSSRSGDDLGFLLFADDNGETAELFISALQLRNHVTDSLTISKLGGVKAGGIKLSNAKSWHANLDIAYADSTILDYEHKTFHFVIPANSTADSAMLTFNTYDKATSNKGNAIKIALNQPFEWTVTSEDSSNSITWKACVRKAYLGTGINDHINVENLAVVYPNPASKQITIGNIISSNSSYQIIDVLGKIVQKGSLSLQNETVVVSGIKNGIYFILIKQNETVQAIKVYIDN
jgi:hypothetical protein